MLALRSQLSGSAQHHERITIDGTAEELDLVHRVVEAGIEILAQRREYSVIGDGIGRSQEASLAPIISGTARPKPVDTSAIFADHGKDSPL